MSDVSDELDLDQLDLKAGKESTTKLGMTRGLELDGGSSGNPIGQLVTTKSELAPNRPRRLSTKVHSSSSALPIRHSNRSHHSNADFLEYALHEVGISPDVWEAAADAHCGGDVHEFLGVIDMDYTLSYLLLYRPQEFKFFLESQVLYWSGEPPLSLTSSNLVAAANEICYNSSQVSGELPLSLTSSSSVVEEAANEIYYGDVKPSSIFIFTYLPHQSKSFNRFYSYNSIGMPTLSKPMITVDKFPDYYLPACVVMGQFIYFVGGVCKFGDRLYSSKKMFAFRVEDLKNNHQQPPPLHDFPNMNVGKSRPLAIAAKGMIYILSLTMRDIDDSVVSKHRFDFSPNPRDWTLVDDEAWSDWYCGAFEVYDPSTCEWTILPLPYNPCGFKPPVYVPSLTHLSKTIGHAVVRDKLFFFCEDMETCLYTFDTRTLCWKFYDKGSRGTVKVQDYYDSLAYQLLENGMCGQGLLVKDTLYALSSVQLQDGDDLAKRLGIWAYHVPESLYEKHCHSSLLEDFSVDRVYGTSVSMLIQASILYLGDDTIGCLHVKEIEKDDLDDDLPPFEDWVYVPPELRPCFTTFKVREVEAGSDGKRHWLVDSPVENDICGLSGSVERFLACYAR